jgi:hypothetical protein
VPSLVEIGPVVLEKCKSLQTGELKQIKKIETRNVS